MTSTITKRIEDVDTDEGVDMSQTSIMLTLQLAKAGNRKRVSSNRVEVDADKDAISVSKELLDSPQYEDIRSFDGMIRKWVYVRALPAVGLRTGTYRIPIALLEEVDTKLGEFDAERAALVDKFCNVYQDQVAEAQDRLRELYDERDYPPVGAVQDAFTFEYRYVSFAVPQALKSISIDLLRREQEKARLDVQSEAEEIKDALRASFAELLDHAVSRLAVKDGKPLIFRDSMIGNIEQFLEYFGQRNVVGDFQLEELVTKARAAMTGVEKAQDLRDNGALRGRVRSALGEIKKTMDDNVMVKPGRRISFDDE